MTSDRSPEVAAVRARPSDQALVSDEARSGLHPSGFDPSRCPHCGQGPEMHSVVDYTVVCKPGVTDIKDE